MYGELPEQEHSLFCKISHSKALGKHPTIKFQFYFLQLLLGFEYFKAITFNSPTRE